MTSWQLKGREQASRQACELVPGEGQEDGGELEGLPRLLLSVLGLSRHEGKKQRVCLRVVTDEHRDSHPALPPNQVCGPGHVSCPL